MCCSVAIRYRVPVGQAIGFCTDRMTPLPEVDTVPTARWNVRTAPTDFLQSGGVVSTATTGVPVIRYVSFFDGVGEPRPGRGASALLDDHVAVGAVAFGALELVGAGFRKSSIFSPVSLLGTDMCALPV